MIKIQDMTLSTGYRINNLCVSTSQSLAVIGRAGSGKTELCLELLNCRQHANPELSYSSSWKDIGYVPTNPSLLFSGMKSTLKGEIELSLQFLGRCLEPISDIAEAFGVSHLLHRDPFSLSGGEAMKAALAIVGIKRPKVWVLDQIFDWLHPEIRDELRRTIHANASSDIIVVETHSSIPTWIEEFDICLFFDHDHNVLQGTFSELRPQLADHFLLGASYPHRTQNLYHRQTRVPSTRFESSECKGLQVEGLVYDYPVTRFEIGPVNLVCQPGDIVALVGQNGAGKTTLLKCLGLLLEPKRGSIIINSRNATKVPYKRAREMLYCFQNPDDQIFMSTLYEEMMITLTTLSDEKKELDQHLLKDFCLDDILQDDPLLLPRPFKRILTLASSLQVSPPCLLLDEPTAGLDGYQKSMLAEHLQRYSHNQGIALIVSHDVDFVDHLASLVVTVQAGNVISVDNRLQ
jgi:energy-coupling factor transporter ATP-binding protein EcfA2